MKRQHFEHAERVVKSFKQKLTANEITSLGDEHFDQLALLIESAISAAVLDEVELAADKLHQLAESLKKHAEHI